MNKIILVKVPLNLCNLLVARPEDMKNPEEYEKMSELAKSMLRVLIEGEHADRRSKKANSTS